MAKNGPEISSSESLNATIERSADKRADYTRKFLLKIGISINDFVENLKKEPWNISVAGNDSQSLALGVLELQKNLGFKQIDNPKGCDGILGPFTWKKYQEALVSKKSRTDRTRLLDDIKPPQVTAVQIEDVEPKIPQPELPISAPPKVVAQPIIQPSPAADIPAGDPVSPEKGKTSAEVSDKVPLTQTIFVGDSITAGMAVSKSINGGKECFKGGMQTGWMLKNFRERFFDKDDKGEYKLKPEYQNGAVKKVVIEGGFNDITSLKSVESVKQNLSAIYQLAREAGLTIVASTYFDWDAKKGVEIFRRDFKKHGWGEYPLSPEELQKRIQDLNQWVLSQHDPANGFTAIDLQTEMSDHEKYPRGDFVHPSGKGSKAMAAYIKEKGGIVDKEN